MSKKLLFALLAAALVAATVVGLTVPATPAQAELRTVTVQLADGSTTTVTVDVPPGTPLDQVQIPPVPTPTTPVPVPTLPTPSPTPSPTPNPSPGSGGNQDQNNTQTNPSPDNGAPNASGKGQKQGTTGGTQKAKPNALGDVPNAQPQGEVKKKLDEINAKLREPDGSPAPTNPTFFDALPGPAVASGVPNFVIQKFQVPIFLLPIYQAAGIQYGIRWEVLAAINEIETDYGRNLNVSTAGAVGWMQFLPSTWKTWGVDADNDRKKDPYNPVDAIFGAARYLKAAGADNDIRKAVFAYNHATWYVDSVMLRARLLAGSPPDFVGSLTGLTQGRFPIAARARYADDPQEAQQLARAKKNKDKTAATKLVQDSAGRTGIDIFSAAGAPIVAVNDAKGEKIGESRSKGRHLWLQQAYGNRYTYSHMGSVSKA